MEKKFVKVKELAQLWGITPRRINQLCAAGFFPGAYKDGKFWLIPADAQKPSILRSTKAVNTVRTPSAGLLPCAVGLTSFKEVSTECYYVDKTLLIKDILDDHSKVYLFTRPRRFGKTLTMDMLRTYFEQTDEDTSIYFTNKKIWSVDKSYQDFQGKYPVIFLSFKDAHQNSWEEMYHCLIFIIKQEFIRHSILLTSDAVNEYDKRFFLSIINETAIPTDYQFALGKLSSMLHAHYGRKAIVIIDEYDTPIQQGHLNRYYDEVVLFFRNLLSSVLKDNEHLEFGILTGILRIAKESLFSGLNNLVVNTILDEKYSAYFGFTRKEVSEMASYYASSDKLPEIQAWYDGYLFGQTEIYNPWSVTSYFHNRCIPKAFWSRTSGNEIIGQLLKASSRELYENLSLLLQGGEIQSLVDTDIIYPEITGDPDTVCSFLLISGYLRITHVLGDLNDNPICSLRLPNREIKSIFQKEILSQFNPLFTGSIIRNFELALRTGNTTLFTKTLEDYLLRSASYFDTAQENFYHGMLFGMLAIMSDHYYITSNREGGEGRFDVALEPMDKTQPGYIIEFKADTADTKAHLSELAKEALQQIHEKKYYADMEYHGVKTFGLFGIAFHGKQAATAYDTLSL